MRKDFTLGKILLLLALFSIQATASTDGKAGATKTIDEKAAPTVSQIDKWKALIDLKEYTTMTKKPEVINYSPNHYQYIDRNSDNIVINGRTYDYDASVGASRTVADLINHSQTLKYDGKKGQDKINAMYWSVQPPKGIIVGDYYSGKKVFDGGYEAFAEVVSNKNEIVHIELDEIPPVNYYASEWAGETKRRSGYGFFQAKSPRTDYTLATLINGMSYLEWQVLKNQSLDFEYKTLFGSSNSARNGFVPLLKEMGQEVKAKTSNKRYVGITQPYDVGISTRLEVIYEDEKIVDLKYDEIFADDKSAIKNDTLKEFYRQSKYASIEYNRITNKSFRTFVNTLRREVLRSQSLTDFPTKALKLDLPHIQEAYENYLFAVKKIKNIK